MSPDLLRAAVGCSPELAQAWAEPLTAAMAAHNVDTPRRQAAFLAQIAHESGGLRRVVENLNYSAARLIQVWPARFRSIGNATVYAGKPEALANFVYGGRMGNGPPVSGDGWRYRGRGLIQITGRDNYRAAGAALGLDLIAHPERIEEREHAAMSAAWYWSSRGLNEQADEGDLDNVSDRINLGRDTAVYGDAGGFADRAARQARADAALGVA